MSTPPLSPSTPTAVAGASPGAGRSPLLDACRNVAGYLAAVGVTVLLLAAAMRLWHAKLTVPLFDGGDYMVMRMVVQNVIETGWFLDSPRLGAPGVQDLRDYPLADVLHFGTIKLLASISRNPAVVINLYVLLPFPLTALAAYFTLRRLGLDRLAALVAGVLYACTPYHFFRMQGHMLLGTYYLIPLMVLVILKVYFGRIPGPGEGSAEADPPRRRLPWGTAGAVFVCVLTGLGGVYYAFFSCFLLLAAGVRAAFRDRRWAPVGVAAGFILCISGSLGAALSPSFLYWARHGKNPDVAARLPAEADLYGLKVSEMLLPMVSHRIASLGQLREDYLALPRPQTGEVWSTSLGLLGCVGFVYLVGRFLWRRRAGRERVADGLAYLNVAAVALGSVGGLGACFAFYVSPMIRCYNRISIFIAFFALAGLFLAVQRWLGRRAVGRYAGVAYAALLGNLLVLGAWDQTTDSFIPHYAELRRLTEDDREFATRIEARLPPGSMVFQLPHVPFPEHPAVHALSEYELLRPYLHSRTLRWSYGGVAGRDGNRWLDRIASVTMPELVKQLALGGFAGVYLDRAGFPDRGAAAEGELSRLLGVEPLVSRNGRQTFFDMTDFVRGYRGRFNDAEWALRCEAALHPLYFKWAGSFSVEERHPTEGTWHWCGARGQLRITNSWSRPRKVHLKMDVTGWSPDAAPHRLTLGGDLCQRDLTVSGERRPVELDMTVGPGEHVISFDCDGPRLKAPGEPRELVFRVNNFVSRVEELWRPALGSARRP